MKTHEITTRRIEVTWPNGCKEEGVELSQNGDIKYADMRGNIIARHEMLTYSYKDDK